MPSVAPDHFEVKGWRSSMRSALDRLFPHPAAEVKTAMESSLWKMDQGHEYCGRCGATMAAQGVTDKGCAFCAGQSLPWERVVRLGAYQQPLDRWIWQMKFHGQWSWASWFGGTLAQGLGTQNQDDPTLVCPVPMHWRRRWRRGYNQAALMANAMAKERGWPMVELLHRTRWTKPQTKLMPTVREANIRGSVAMEPVDLRNWTVWLVDDVKTTGSTARACARLLRQAGALRVNLAVAAVADPRGQGFSAT